MRVSQMIEKTLYHIRFITDSGWLKSTHYIDSMLIKTLGR